MMGDRNNRVCPVERAGILDHRIRRWLQDPQKILRPYIEEGMTVLDIGCGPGFFLLTWLKWLVDPVELLLLIYAIDFREFKRNIFLVINHSMVWREIYEK